jgi:hypothetical protein
MEKIIKMKKIIIYSIIMCIAGCFFSCQEMDGNYKEYIVPGGITYLQKADSVKVYTGWHRVKVEFPKPVDPKITNARIYWNNYTDSVDVVVPADKDTVSCIIDGLPENNYTFYIRTYDAKGNTSIPSEVNGRALGEIYVGSLLQRSVLSTMVDEAGSFTINWSNGALSDGALATEIEYGKSGGGTAILAVAPGETRTVINDAMPGTEYKLRTSYFTKGFLDTFYTGYLTGTVETQYTETQIPRTGFVNAKLPTDYYAASGTAANVQLEGAWDGIKNEAFNAAQAYANVFASANTAGWPKHFTIDLNRTVVISRFKMYQFGRNRFSESSPHSFELWGSMAPNPDGSFDESWTKLGTYIVEKPSGYDLTASDKVGTVTAADEAAFFSGGNYRVETDNQIPVKYLRVRILDTFAVYSGTPANYNWLIVDEMEFWGGIFD